MSRLPEWEARWRDPAERHQVLVELLVEAFGVTEAEADRALRRQLAAWVREVAYRPGSVEKVAELAESSGLDPWDDEDELVDLRAEMLLEEARRLLDVKDLAAGAAVDLAGGVVPDALPGDLGE